MDDFTKFLILAGSITAIALFFIWMQVRANKQLAQKIKDTGFTVSKKVICQGMALYVDEVHKKWLIKAHSYQGDPKIYNYSDLIEFEVYEDGSSIAKSRAGSALTGGAGSWAVTGVCESLQLRVRVRDLEQPQIVVRFIMFRKKKSSLMYHTMFESAREFASVLAYIQNGEKPSGPAEQPGTSPPPSQAEELKKFHDLMKQGILTEAEFQAKKREILGQ